MSVENFIPEVWSSKILQAFDKTLVYGNLCNRDYEGEISGFGDTVHINEIGAPTVATYTKNSTSITPETLDDASKTLLIDQAKYFAFNVDDIDKAQTKPKVFAEATRKAGIALKDTVDQHIASLYSDAGVVTGLGTDGTPIEINSANVIDYMLLINEKLDDVKCPADGRYIVVPPWFITKLVLAGIENLNPNSELFKNGQIGHALGFDIYKSVNVPNTSSAKYKIIAGIREAMSFASQIVSIEAYRPQSSFSDALKGLQVYGSKVVQPNGLACLTANKAAES